MEVVIKSFIDFEVSNLGTREYSKEPVIEFVSENNEDQEDPEENEEWHSWVLGITNACEYFSPSVTSWFDVTSLVDEIDVVVTE